VLADHRAAAVAELNGTTGDLVAGGFQALVALSAVAPTM